MESIEHLIVVLNVCVERVRQKGGLTFEEKVRVLEHLVECARNFINHPLYKLTDKSYTEPKDPLRLKES